MEYSVSSLVEYNENDVDRARVMANIDNAVDRVNETVWRLNVAQFHQLYR